jgi:rare lipoprotein A (peptidoglycan hydrolase)
MTFGRRKQDRRDRLAKAAHRVLERRENLVAARRNPERLAFLIADQILADEQTRRKPRALAIAAPAVIAATTTVTQPAPHPGCTKTFNLRVDRRAARRIYAGTRHVTLHDLRLLGYLERCQARLRNWPVARRFNRTLDREHKQVMLQARLSSSLDYAVASWYYDTSGACASPNGCSTYGVANLSLPFGTRVLFDYHGRTVTATVDDRGPYVGGRTWDLNQTTAGALGFSGVDTVGYRILG